MTYEFSAKSLPMVAIKKPTTIAVPPESVTHERSTQVKKQMIAPPIAILAPILTSIFIICLPSVILLQALFFIKKHGKHRLKRLSQSLSVFVKKYARRILVKSDLITKPISIIVGQQEAWICSISPFKPLQGDLFNFRNIPQCISCRLASASSYIVQKAWAYFIFVGSLFYRKALFINEINKPFSRAVSRGAFTCSFFHENRLTDYGSLRNVT